MKQMLSCSTIALLHCCGGISHSQVENLPTLTEAKIGAPVSSILRVKNKPNGMAIVVLPPVHESAPGPTHVYVVRRTDDANASKVDKAKPLCRGRRVLTIGRDLGTSGSSTPPPGVRRRSLESLRVMEWTRIWRSTCLRRRSCIWRLRRAAGAVIRTAGSCGCALVR